MTFTLTLARYGSHIEERHDDIHEAIASAWGAVETNEAAPVKLQDDEGLIGEFYDITGVYDDDRYSRSMSAADVVKLIQTMKAEEAQARRDYEQRKAAEHQARMAELSELADQGATIEYLHAYKREHLSGLTLPPIPYAREDEVGLPQSWPFITTPKQGKVVGVCVHVDMYRVQDPAAGPTGMAPGRKHYLAITEDGDHVPLEHLTRKD